MGHWALANGHYCTDRPPFIELRILFLIFNNAVTNDHIYILYKLKPFDLKNYNLSW